MKKMNFFTRFLIGCAGADYHTLKQCTSAEIQKAAITGTCVLIPALLGIVSGTYAMFTFSNNTRMSFIVGLVWGLIVFIIDRAVVASTKPGEFNLGVVSRLFLACIFAFLISVPLELRVFRDAIQEKLVVNQNANVKNISENVADQIAGINSNIESRKAKVDELRLSYIGEVDGTSGSGAPYRGPIAIEKQKLWNQEYADYEKYLKEMQGKIYALENQEKNQISISKDSQAQGFLGQMRALGELSKEDGTVFWGIWLIRLFFLSIELIPILIKLGSGSQGNAYYTIVNKNTEIAINVNEQLSELRAEEMVKQQRAIVNQEMLELQFMEGKAIMDDQIRRNNFYMDQLKKACDRKLQMQEYVYITVKDEFMRDNLFNQLEQIYQGGLSTLMALVNKRYPTENYIDNLK